MVHSLCRPLVFNQSTTNTQSFPLNSSKFDVSVVSAMIYDIHQPTWNQCEPYHDIEANDQIPHPLWLVIKFPPSRARKGVKCPGYARGGMLKLRFD